MPTKDYVYIFNERARRGEFLFAQRELLRLRQSFGGARLPTELWGRYFLNINDISIFHKKQRKIRRVTDFLFLRGAVDDIGTVFKTITTHPQDPSLSAP